MANQYDFLDLMKAGGYNPLDGGITTDEMDAFKILGLINETNKNKQAIEKMNKPFGMIGDSVQPNKPIINLPPAKESIPQPNPQSELLKKQQRGNMLIALGDLLRGKDATAGFTQRQAGFDAQRERAERQAKQEQKIKEQEEFIKNNPELAGAIRMNQLFGFNMPGEKPKRIIKGVDGRNYYEDGTLVLNNVKREEKKKVKGDFVVDILSKIQDDPTYGTTDNPFSVGDQTILDTLTSVDPLEIYKRDLMNKRLGGIIDNEPKETTTPTVTTQEEFDKLPSGTLYKEEDGNTYRKP